MMDFHCLPVCKRIEFKSLCITHNAIFNSTPFDLFDLPERYQPIVDFRRNNQLLLPEERNQLTVIILK